MKKLLIKILEFFTSRKFLAPIVYILLGTIIYRIISNIIDNIMKKRNKHKAHTKEKTVINLIKSVIRYTIIVIVLLSILEEYGINTGSILASLGIAGVVLGLALQDTIKNMLAGILIIFDNRYNIGDIVEINSFTGEVISLGLQTTKLKSYTGEIFTISNSSITTIKNYSQSDSLLVMDLPVSYTTDIDKLEKVLKIVGKKIEKLENVKGKVELLGIEAFDSSSINYRITVLCKPYTHFAIKRQSLILIKKEFDKEGIEIPYTKLDVYVKEHKK